MGNFGSRRKPISEHVYADSVVWKCSNCDCWSRDEFVYVAQPVCPLCEGKMNRVTKNIRIE
ncbi:cold-shock protein [Alicyclobacillus tolerans]|uniref:cold-inducible protein YdjO-related protein n=1 Tax=Alicyclobacillus tolerans TaxID=90970 RepID=UPI001F2FE0EA|nr:cold-inducible protein YdjO-related protein [Alicyclobacillus tolerans]MCF8564186.1 cold-shock protein [Alicyclobacillus tolerans]